MLVEPVDDLPAAVMHDIISFIEKLIDEPFDDNTLRNYGVTTEAVMDVLRRIFL